MHCSESIIIKKCMTWPWQYIFVDWVWKALGLYWRIVLQTANKKRETNPLKKLGWTNPEHLAFCCNYTKSKLQSQYGPIENANLSSSSPAEKTN